MQQKGFEMFWKTSRAPCTHEIMVYKCANVSEPKTKLVMYTETDRVGRIHSMMKERTEEKENYDSHR